MNNKTEKNYQLNYVNQIWLYCFNLLIFRGMTKLEILKTESFDKGQGSRSNLCCHHVMDEVVCHQILVTFEAELVL